MNIVTWIQKTLPTKASSAAILIRIFAGAIFLTEGIQKFLYPAALGVGRFTNIGIPIPEISAPFVGVVEIFFGSLLLLGLLTRLATIPLIIDMLVAIATTIVPMFFGTGPEPNGQGEKFGFWGALHSGRLDFALLLGLIYLLIRGAGPWALDALLTRKRARVEKDGAYPAAPTVARTLD
ncbi:MAG: DoxX family protein [Acidobacteriaceae bacterium]|nr:DoxX family protein [Acidobacteriaceae bacterium]